MAKTVQILGRSYLPGPGFNTSGSPKQGKTQTWGIITMAPYTVGGEPVSPNDLGLTTIDHVSFTIKQLTGAEVTAVEASVIWQSTANEVVVFKTAATQAAAGDNPVLTFFAVGDGARDVESLA